MLGAGVGFTVLADFKIDFVGLPAVARFADVSRVFLSILVLLLSVDLRSILVEVGRTMDDCEEFGMTTAAFLAGEELAGLLFSSPESTADLFRSSMELVDCLGLCPSSVAEAVAALAFGRLPTSVAAGRVGGLLSPLPGFVRDIEADVDLVAELGVAAAARFVAVAGRLGGMPFRRGELGVVLRLTIGEGPPSVSGS